MKRRRHDVDAKVEKLAARENPLEWWTRIRDESVDGAIDKDVERSCTSKDRYSSEESARAFAAMNNMSGVLFTYECRYCLEWHLTRKNIPGGTGKP